MIPTGQPVTKITDSPAPDLLGQKTMTPRGSPTNFERGWLTSLTSPREIARCLQAAQTWARRRWRRCHRIPINIDQAYRSLRHCLYPRPRCQQYRPGPFHATASLLDETPLHQSTHAIHLVNTSPHILVYVKSSLVNNKAPTFLPCVFFFTHRNNESLIN